MVNQTKELFVSLIYFLLRLTAIFKMIGLLYWKNVKGALLLWFVPCIDFEISHYIW